MHRNTNAVEIPDIYVKIYLGIGRALRRYISHLSSILLTSGILNKICLQIGKEILMVAI
jgi:hypothetical protein